MCKCMKWMLGAQRRDRRSRSHNTTQGTSAKPTDLCLLVVGDYAAVLGHEDAAAGALADNDCWGAGIVVISQHDLASDPDSALSSLCCQIY